MNHLATVLELLASKAGAATAAAVLAVGSVTVVQQVAPLEIDTVAAEVDEDPGAGDTPAEDTTGGEDTTDGGEPTDGEPTDGEPTDGGDADASDGTEGAPEEPEQDDDASDGDEDPSGTGEDEDHGRGSATSERVHAAQVGDADVRPGDPGFGAAVSESARSGGHGQRVSAAARGEAAPEDGGDQAAEPATASREDRGASAGKGNGKGHGKGKSKARG